MAKMTGALPVNGIETIMYSALAKRKEDETRNKIYFFRLSTGESGFCTVLKVAYSRIAKSLMYKIKDTETGVEFKCNECTLELEEVMEEGDQ